MVFNTGRVMGRAHRVLRLADGACEELATRCELSGHSAEGLLIEARNVGDPLLEAIILRTQGWAHLVEGEYDGVCVSA